MKDEVDFLHANKHQSWFQHFGWQSFLQVILSGGSLFFACRWTSKFLQVGIIIFDGNGQTCPKYQKKKVSQLLLCSIVMQNIQIFYGGPVLFGVTCSLTISTYFKDGYSDSFFLSITWTLRLQFAFRELLI